MTFEMKIEIIAAMNALTTVNHSNALVGSGRLWMATWISSAAGTVAAVAYAAAAARAGLTGRSGNVRIQITTTGMPGLPPCCSAMLMQKPLMIWNHNPNDRIRSGG